ncbi:hypothetical protein [Modicisalibacter luteus]|uniref:Uncharacterized protein n=1 Tax=Modicisalibacter luteus TaxID=453962 RepID=A0ABV7M4I2_9GAMM|nr:hypothetical protein [Halomonas lutea]GHA86204.1 hypothetical protein GCM10007159_04210 [Halomonas lutea]
MAFNKKQLKGAFNLDEQALGVLRTHLIALESDFQTRYDSLNRKDKVTALFQDLAESSSLPESLEELSALLPEQSVGQLMRLYNQITSPSGKGPDVPAEETVTLGDTDEDVFLEGMGATALALNLSADILKEEYHGEFTFDGSGPSEIQTFEADDPDPEAGTPDGYTPVGIYRLTNTEQLVLDVAANTGFGGTVHANAAASLRVDAAGLLSPYATVHGASLTQATFTLGALDDRHYGHYLDIEAPNLEHVTIDAESTLVLSSIAETDSLSRVDAVIDDELLVSGFDLHDLTEANLSGAGRAVFYSDELARSTESIRVDAGELRGDQVLPGEDTLSLRIQAFDGAERGTAEIIGSNVGLSSILIAGRDMTYAGDGGGLVRYTEVGDWDHMASFSVHAGTEAGSSDSVQALSLSMWDLVARGDISRDNVALKVEGNSYVETGDFHVLTGATLHSEGEGGMVNIDTDNVVTLNRFIPSYTDTATYNSAVFARNTGETQWSIDDEGLFDGTFDLDMTITNDDADTLEALLFEDAEGDLFYVLDTKSEAGIEVGADNFLLGEVGEGWVNDASVHTAQKIDRYIDENGLELLGVGETTLTDPYAMA